MSTNPSKAYAARVHAGLLLLLILSSLCIAWLLVLANTRARPIPMTGGPPAGTQVPRPGPADNEDAPQGERESVDLSPARAVEPHADPFEGAGSPAQPIDPRPDRFEGLGRLRGSVQVRGRQPLPEHWSLVLEPSRSVTTPSAAEHRRIEYSATSEFDVVDLPLGAYSVSVQAPGMNSLPRQVLLQKPVTDVFVTLSIHPAGFLTGSVAEAGGRPVADIEILLEPASGGELRSQRTDGAGTYVFENVLDGEYRLFVDNATNPPAPPRELVFKAPSLHMPPIVVPPLGEIEICVLDGSGNPLEGVFLRGYGDEGGNIEAQTNRDGTARANRLPPGLYTVIASSPSLGEARGRCRLEPGGHARIELGPKR